jgi:hypothetical protein
MANPSLGGAYNPAADYVRTGTTDTGGTYSGATLSGTTTLGAGATLTTPNIGAATGTSLQATSFLKSSGAAASGGVGYSTGAGGTATQGVSRSTGVTMAPNPCLSGTITTRTDSLAGLATADFIVTNGAVAIGDVVVVSIQSGSNSGAAIVSVSVVTAGTFTIRVSNTNAAAGTAETGALLINFAIIKAVSA